MLVGIVIMENSMKFLKKLKRESTNDLAIAFSGYKLKGNEISTSLFTIAQI